MKIRNEQGVWFCGAQVNGVWKLEASLAPGSSETCHLLFIAHISDQTSEVT
jgi:hypothetical protein